MSTEDVYQSTGLNPYQEIDRLRHSTINGVRSTIYTDQYDRQSAIDNMVVLATKLDGLLQSEGFSTNYTPDIENHTQSIRVYWDESIESTISVRVYLFEMWVASSLVPDTQELVINLRSTSERYRAQREESIRIQAARAYCKGCKYSDGDVRYCGKGMEMQPGCSHLVPKKVEIYVEPVFYTVNSTPWVRHLMNTTTAADAHGVIWYR